MSGIDGRYTELDAINHRIPQGYAEGDLKPHRIRRLPDGTYWLVEQESPAYYTTFQPVQIVYEWQPEIRIVRVNDRPVTGRLILKKTDSAGGPLEGAVFELRHIRKRRSWRQKFCPEKFREERIAAACLFLWRLTAPVEKTNLPVGRCWRDGTIRPFWYELREVEAPPGYELNPEVFCWQFAPDTGVASYPWNGQAQYQITVTDRKAPEPEPPGPDTPEPEKPEPDAPEPKPPEPQKPEEPPKTPGDFEHENPKTPQPEIQPVLRIGKILAWYQPSSPDGLAVSGSDGRWQLRPAGSDVRHTGFYRVCSFIGSRTEAADPVQTLWQSQDGGKKRK
ncbi:MAG: collagen binding domain-containing protein [Clostridium fessum]